MIPTLNFREREGKWIVTYRVPTGQRRFKRFLDESDAQAWMATLDDAPDGSAPTTPSAPTPDTPSEPATLDGLTRGTEVTISSRGESNPGGRFRFDRFHDGDGSLTCWGPVNSQRAQWRSFRPDRVRQVHRKVKDRTAVIESEAA